MNLSWARDYVLSLGYNVYYIAVYWSQNYWLDIHDEGYQSDTDYKCIIIPTLDDLIRNSKPVSRVVDFPNFIHTGHEKWVLLSIKRWEMRESRVDSYAEELLKWAKAIRDNYTILPRFDTKNAIIELSYSIIKSHLWNLK